MDDKLDTNVTDNLFSVGQKQLLCLARAALLGAKMMVLDEATANVDLVTDNLIQKKLRKGFKDSTVLIIAHRLATVIDSDRILVMEKGSFAEYDIPFKLLANKDSDTSITNTGGWLAKMLASTGEDSAQSLFDIAKEKYETVQNEAQPE